MKFFIKLKSFICRLKLKYKRMDKNFWVFSSYGGKYDDSPRLLSEYIHLHYPQIQIHWLLSKTSFNQVPEYVVKLDFDNKQDRAYALLNASVMIDNIFGINCKFLYTKNRKKRIRFVFDSFLDKKIHQHTYSFWHGMGMKSSMGERDDLIIYNLSFGNMTFLLGSQNTIDKIKRRTLFKANDYLLTGCPRNDILLSNRFKVDEIKEKLGLPQDKKIVLYAPTFRGNTKVGDFDIEMSGIYQFQLLDIEKLLDTFSIKFGGDFIFVIRFHHLVEEHINLNKIFHKYEGRVFSGNVSTNMIDYLCVADILISDYSSTSFDFIVTKKPIFLFLPDYEEYISKYKIVKDIKCLPFAYAFTFEDLLCKINEFNENEYESKISTYFIDEGYLITDHSLQTVANYIIRKEKIKK